MTVNERIAAAGVLPVVVLDNKEDAVPIARAMLQGGIDTMEITFRTAAAADAIKAVSTECPDMLVGAGTVLTVAQCEQAVNNGAAFIVSPGFDADVVDWCVAHNVPVFPGCVTPTEIMAALKKGLSVLKFFPAGVYGGLAALKSLAAPFGGVTFIPTGGVNVGNLAEFSAAPFVHAVGGTWICPKADVTTGNFAHITALCREAKEIVNNQKGERL